MLRKIVESKFMEDIWHELVFDDGANNGFGFPCDQEGNVIPDLNEAARSNLNWCLEHPEEFVRFNQVVERKSTWREPAHGICDCGETVYLQNEYMGSCQCGRCGQWYSLSGQELLPPNEWGWDGTDWDEGW